MADAAPTPVAKFSIELLVMSNSSVSVRVTREMVVEGTDPKVVDEGLGPAMEKLGDLLGLEVGSLKNEHMLRELYKR